MIIRSYELMISIRFLIKGKSQTLLILFGIAAGVAVQFFLSALIGGLQINLIDKTVGTSAHIMVMPADSIPVPLNNVSSDTSINEYKTGIYRENTEILNWKEYVNFFRSFKGIVSVNPVVSGQRFIEKGGVNTTVLVKGITFPDGADIYKFNKNIKSGNSEITGNNIIMGIDLSEKLKLETGDKFFMNSGDGKGDFFVVSAIIDLGSSQGNNIVIMSLDRARNFFSVEGVTGIEIQVDAVFQAETMAGKLRNEFKRIKIESWIERNRELLTALNSQSSSSNVIQFFILFSISLGIASVLGIAAAQKSKQLGILKAMGVDNKGAAFIFLIQGLILGFAGSMIGLLAGLGLGAMFMTFAHVGFGLELSASNIFLPVILAIFASGLASIIPARSAGKLTPIEVIRNG
jgi:lipoprotein-releasing system permease protein